ncbi:DotA/TraY family protein [Duganella sp. PWIR1]
MMWLRGIFGELFGGTESTPISEIVKLLNGAALIIAGCLACYTMIFGTVSTAHDGEVLGRRWSSVWVPIRTAWGMALIIPVKGGYCTAQFIIAWAITQGIGLADTAWQKYTEVYVAKSNMAPSVTLPNVQNLAASILESELCMEAYNKVVSYSAGPISYMSASSLPSGGRQYGGGGINADSCGSVSYNTVAYSDAPTGEDSILGGEPIPTSGLTSIQQAHIQATQKMESTLAPLAKQIIEYRDKGGALPSMAPMFSAIEQYQNDIASAAKSSVASNDTRAAIVKAANKDGWVSAGSWFMKAAQLQDATRDAIAGVPQTRPMRIKDFQAFATDLQAYMTSSQNVLAQAANSVSEKDMDAITGAGNTSNPWMKAFASFTNKKATSVMKGAMLDDNRDPMMAIKDYGDWIMVASETTFATTVIIKAGVAGAKAVSDSWLGNVAGLATFGMSSAAVGALQAGIEMFVTLATFISSAMFMFGASIAVVLPKMPALMFFGCAVSFILLCAEAIFAAPIWAAYHLLPNGDGATGKASQGYMLILGLLTRPVLMVAGFVFAMMGLVVIMPTFNNIFLKAFWVSNVGSLVGVGTLLVSIGLYAGGVTTIVYLLFKAIYVFPNNTLRWIGGGVEQMGEMAEKMHGDSKLTAVAAAATVVNNAANMSRQGSGASGAGSKGLGDGKAPTMNAKSSKAPAAPQKGQDTPSRAKQSSGDQTQSSNAGVSEQPATEAQSEPASSPSEAEQAGPPRPDNLRDSSED